MKKSTPILLSTGRLCLSLTVVILLSLACTVSGVPAPTQDLNALGTSVMQTMISGATGTALAGFPVAVVDTPTATPTPVFTLPPTFTPSATLSPTLAFTPTPMTPLISVSVATNCRVGPGKVYDRVGALLVGEVAEVVGRDQVGNYWYIRNPRQSNGYCWLWGEYATVTGNFAALPVYTPPPTPTPTPDFEADYDGLEACNGWWADIWLNNPGGLIFESIGMTIRDLDTNVAVSMYTDVFHDIDGCSGTNTRDRLHPGASHVVSGPVFNYNPTGHTLRATITLCSRDGQKGICVTKKIKFKP